MRKIIVMFTMLSVLVLMTACGSASQQAWDITVINSDGTGVEGVELQICSDSMCMLFTTDSNGEIEFDGEEASYELHVKSCPDGYDYDGDIITLKQGEKCQILLESSDISTGTDSTEDTDTSVLNSEDGRVKISFSSVDMNGNVIDDSIFTQNKVTMINLWEPWCDPCKNEMPYLDKLYQEYKDQGFMVIGIHRDDEDLESVVASTGVTYPIVKTTDVFKNIMNETNYYPTTLFVDSDGYIILLDDETSNNIRNIMIEDAKQSYLDELEKYKNGEYDDYKSDESYAEYFAQLDEMLQDSSKIDEAIEDTMDKSLYPDKGYYSCSWSYDTWKQIIEYNLESVL